METWRILCSGRLNRAAFWHAALVYLCFWLLFGLVVVGVMAALQGHGHVQGSGIPVVLSSTPISVRRLHDRNKTGWWLLAFYVFPMLEPYVVRDGTLLTQVLDALAFVLTVWGFVEIGLLPGTRGPNRFGPDPLAPQGASTGAVEGGPVSP